ncbi:MAG TPA: GlsB/YeaQ/YmgE family stress response membrane protein [Pseudolabrys sp.]
MEVMPDFWGQLITATIGAIVFLLIWRAIRRA